MEWFARHQCMIYEGSPAKHLPGLAAQIISSIQANYRCMYFNSLPMVAGIRSYLSAAGLDVTGELFRGSLILSSSDSHLVNGRFDPARMLDLLRRAVEDAGTDGYAGLWAIGDMTWEFGSERNFSKLLEYEWGLEQLFQEQPTLHGVCQYHRDTLPPGAVHQGLCSHRTIYIDQTLSRVNPHYLRPESFSPNISTPSGAELNRMLEGLLG